MVMNSLKGNSVTKINNWKPIILHINVENFYVKSKNFDIIPINIFTRKFKQNGHNTQ